MSNEENFIWFRECGYWTDDWSKLGNRNGMPVCPICEKPGLHLELDLFLNTIKSIDAETPGVAQFILSTNETCLVGHLKTVWTKVKEAT
jgi:hypothetical protein